MSYQWPDGTTVEHFSPLEFDHPDLMDMGFVADLSDLRAKCGFAIKVTDDARVDADMARLYGDVSKWPDSAHLYHAAGQYAKSASGRLMVPVIGGTDLPEYLVRAVDVKPAGVATAEEREEKELEIIYRACRFWKQGRWPHFQLEVATRHLHIDDYDWDGRVARRPNVFPGVSK